MNQKDIKELDDTLAAYLKNRVERLQLEKKFVDLCPIKAGDKVEILTNDTGQHLRFAFVRQVYISMRNDKACPGFNFDKCKKDGTKSSQNDYLGFNETLRRI